jgi:hypothetical protein
MIPSLAKMQSSQGEAVATIQNVLKQKVQVRALEMAGAECRPKTVSASTSA